MSISRISFNSSVPNFQGYTRTENTNNNNMSKNIFNGLLTQDTVQFKSNSKKPEYKTYSCKDADMLKYDFDYSKNSFFNRNYEITGDEIEISIKNRLTGNQEIFGEAFDKNIDLNIDSGLFGIRKGSVTGSINNKLINIKYQANENAKSIKIAGDIEFLDDKEKALLIMLISDKIKYDLKIEQEMEMIAIASSL